MKNKYDRLNIPWDAPRAKDLSHLDELIDEDEQEQKGNPPPFGQKSDQDYGPESDTSQEENSSEEQGDHSKKVDSDEFADFEESDELAKKERAAAFGRSITKGEELLKVTLPPRATIIDDWFKE